MKPALSIEQLTLDMVPKMLAASVEDDGHCAPLATHVFLREGNVVGAAAICAPTLIFWAHSKLLHARESVELAERCKAMARHKQENFLTACSPESPFWALMPRFGFRRLGNVDVFDMPQ